MPRGDQKRKQTNKPKTQTNYWRIVSSLASFKTLFFHLFWFTIFALSFLAAQSILGHLLSLLRRVGQEICTHISGPLCTSVVANTPGAWNMSQHGCWHKGTEPTPALSSCPTPQTVRALCRTIPELFKEYSSGPKGCCLFVALDQDWYGSSFVDVLRKDLYQQHLRLWPFSLASVSVHTENNGMCLGGVGPVLGEHVLGVHPSPQWPLGLLARPLVFLCWG